MIEFQDVSKIYSDGTQALHHLSLNIHKSEFMTIIGPSGCGKTTMLKMINRLIQPTSGNIIINNYAIQDYHIHGLRWNIGYVLQEIALFPHMTIEENIAVVPEMKKWNREDIKKRITELLDMVGLDPSLYKGRKPHELSGGEQQRIGVVRALAADPDIILMDEPFSAVDPISREQLQKDIQKLQREIKKTVVFVTHDMDEALALGDRVCLMRNGEIVQTDTPQQLILNPKTSFVKSFIGERQSPWHTAVEVVADHGGTNVLTASPDELIDYPHDGTFIIQNNDQDLVGVIENGETIENAITLENQITLDEASSIMYESRQAIYPVLKNDKLVGTLSYDDILKYLKQKTKREGGVWG